jgi:hypothetical protein
MFLILPHPSAIILGILKMLLTISIPGDKEPTGLPQQLTRLNKPSRINQAQSKQHISLRLLLIAIVLFETLGNVEEEG